MYKFHILRIVHFLLRIFQWGEGLVVLLPHWPAKMQSRATRWLAVLRRRGETVPQTGRYALRVFGDAVGVEFPTKRPAAVSATLMIRREITKHADPAQRRWILSKKLELAAADHSIRRGKRLFRPLVLLQIFASLRYIDLREDAHLFRTDSSLFGISIGPEI